MRRAERIRVVLFLLSGFFCSATLLLAQSAQDIVQHSENLLKGTSCTGTFRMIVTTPDYVRTLEMKSWWVGNDKALIVITSPSREAGNKTLKVHNDLWMYLRNTETTIKLPPSMMLQSWNGSDFTNDDLVRESNLVRDYAMSIVDTERVEGVSCWKVELLPRPDAPVVWGKILHWVRTSDYLPAATEYYDESGLLVRSMTFNDIRTFGDRKVPSRWRMINRLQHGHSTEFEFMDASFDVPLGDDIFSFQSLERSIPR